MQSYELVSSPVEENFVQIIQEAQTDLFIAAPYIKDYGARVILDSVRTNNLRMLTNLDWVNVTGSGFDIECLLKLWDRFNLSISSLGKLHAKVYIADDRVAFLTSANLTRGGLRENYEYGIIVRDTIVVSAMRADMDEYFGLGNIFTREGIESIKSDAEEIRRLRQELEASIQAKRLRDVLKQKEGELQTKILRNRVQGKTINSIFAETIQYLLRSRGPLSTQELHPLIQNIHPDICDDSIDRVINGQHFGKRWKHLVRNAQQSLKSNGVITVQEGKWHMVG